MADELLGGDTSKKAGDSASSTASDTRIAELQTKLDAMSQKYEEVQRELLDPKYIDFLESMASGGKGEEKVQTREEEEVDFDSMSPKELASYLTKHMDALASKKVQDMASKMEGFKKELDGALVRADIEFSKIKHPDLAEGLQDKEYREQFVQISRENPGWNCERVYRQITLERRASLEDKAAAEAKRKKAELLAATERSSTPSSAVTSKSLTPEEAARIAYMKVMGSLEE